MTKVRIILNGSRDQKGIISALIRIHPFHSICEQNSIAKTRIKYNHNQ